jgi:vesicle coat complex subunit
MAQLKDITNAYKCIDKIKMRIYIERTLQAYTFLKKEKFSYANEVF